MVEYKSLGGNSTSILERATDKGVDRKSIESPREFIEIWKNASLRLILKDRLVIKTANHFVDFNLGFEISSKKRD